MSKQPISQKEYKVFHFENDAKLAVKYKEAFSKQNFNYRNFRNPPKNFIKLIRAEEPDLIIMDTSMPKMDGFSAVQLLKKHKDTSLIPVIGLSDVESWVGVRWAKNLLIDDYWMHSEHSPEEVVDKVISILHPRPLEVNDPASYKLDKQKKSRNKYWYGIGTIIFVLVVIAVFLYNWPGEIKHYEKIFPESAVEIKFNDYMWNYANREYSLAMNFYTEIDNYYANHPVKVYHQEMTVDEYYNNLFNNLEFDRDDTVTRVVEELNSQAMADNLTDDEFVDFVVSFVQSIPYDEAKRQSMIEAKNIYNKQEFLAIDYIDPSFFPRFPYETLFDNTGICTDKALLTISLLKKMGYGVVLFDMDRHVAAGILCPKEHSSFDSGYCYIETTSTGFVIGQVPNEVEEFGQALPQNIQATPEILSDINNDDFIISNIHIFEVSKGKSYGGYVKREPIIKALKLLEEDYKEQLNLLQELEFELSDLSVAIEDTRMQAAGALETYNTTNLFEDYDAYRNIQAQLELNEQKHDLKEKEYDILLTRIEDLIIQYQSLSDFSIMN